jgi:hypothetical protein
LSNGSRDGHLDVFLHIIEALVEGLNIFSDLGGALGATVTVLKEFSVELLILSNELLEFLVRGGHVEG